MLRYYESIGTAKWSSLFLFLICLSWISIGEIDGSAVSETVAGEDMVHDDIVLVGVDPDAAGPGECPVKEGFCGFMAGLDGCYTVNHMIRGLVEPATFDMEVGRIRPGNECHCSNDALVLA